MKAAKAYEDHQAKNGKPDSHAMAKELLSVCHSLCGVLTDDFTCSAGFAGAFIDREVESKGVSTLD
jgi:hypothetical protein